MNIQIISANTRTPELQRRSKIQKLSRNIVWQDIFKVTEPILLRNMRSWDDNDSTGLFHHVSKLQIQIKIQTNKDSRDENMDLPLDSFMCQSHEFKYKYKYEKMRSSRNDDKNLALDSFIMWASLDLLASLHLVVKEILKGGQLSIINYLDNYQFSII